MKLLKPVSVLILLPLLIALVPMVLLADGVSAVKACESDTNSPEDTAKLTILPNGENRGSDTAAKLVEMARQKAREGKDAEAIQWALLCNFSEPAEQAAIKRDSDQVLEYLKK